MKIRWLAFSVSGLLLFGLGISMVGEAIILKYESIPFFWYGALSLIITNSGLCLFGNAIRYRVRLDQKETFLK